MSSFVNKTSPLIINSLGDLELSYKHYETTVGKLCKACSSNQPLQQEEIEKLHRNVMLQYVKFQKSSAEFANLCKTTTTSSSPKEYEIYEENLESYEQSTALEGRVSKLFLALNHTIRTNYPLANIAEPDLRVGDIRSTINLEKPSKHLAKFPHFRKILGDGNCFYTSFTVRFLENIVKKSNDYEAMIKFIRSDADGVKDKNLKQFVIDTLTNLSKNPSSLEKVLKDNQIILPLVRYFRSIVANEMLVNQKTHEETFAISLLGDFPKDADTLFDKSYVQLVHDYVSSMGKDATNISISILCRMLDFPCRIYSDELPKPVDALDGREPKAIFIRASEHYFVAYSKTDKVPFEEKAKEYKKRDPMAGKDTVPDRSSFEISDEELAFSLRPVSISPKDVTPAKKIRITFHFKAGTKNKLYIRGEGSPELSWHKGIVMRHVSKTKWVWETSCSDLSSLKFKVMLNDTTWEKGNDHTLKTGENRPEFIPEF